MKYLIFFLSLTQSFAQNKFFTVKDKSTNVPIYLVVISNQKGYGVYSDEKGSFTLDLASNDTITISHLSYQKLILTKKDFERLNNLTILLEPKIIELNEAKVKPGKLIKKMYGYYDEQTFFKRTGPGGNNDFNVFVNHLRNSSQEIGVINKLYFDLFVDLAEKSNSKVRIRVFSVGKDGLPKDDILNKEIIKTVDRLSPNIKVNISELNIPFPLEGVFIGLEFLCNFERKNLQKKGYSKVITNCPHIPTAKVTNYDEIGNSYFWTLHKNKFQWVCYSNGSYLTSKGNVFKFGAEILQ